jgi:predicted small secreted protein
MKRIIIALLVLCCLLCACKKTGGADVTNGGDVIGEIEKLVPKTDESKEALTESELTGVFTNETYTVNVDSDNGEMVFTVSAKGKEENTGYEWVIKGFFSSDNNRVNYTDAVKYVISYDKNGNERSREKEYDYGSGRMQFTDKDHLTWNNITELSGGSDLVRQK